MSAPRADAMLTVRLDRELHLALARVARRSGRSKSSIVREALVLYLEDIEDAALVKQARTVRGRVKSITEVRKALTRN